MQSVPVEVHVQTHPGHCDRAVKGPWLEAGVTEGQNSLSWKGF